MVIDSSALVAILFQEPDAQLYADYIESASIRLLSACTLLETSMVVERNAGMAGVQEFDVLLHHNVFTIEPFDNQQALLARYAFSTYGKGRHKASLNMGDCFTYALAKSRNMPVLFKGNDFIHTDITSAI